MTSPNGHDIKVAFDHRIFIYQKNGGVSRYFCGIVERLPQHGIAPRVIAPWYATDRLRSLDSGLVLGRHFQPTPRKQRLATVASEVLFRPLAARMGASIVHETYYAARDIAPRRAKTVLTVYDMIHEKFPELFPGDTTHRWKALAVRRADHILCISESTRRDLLDLYPDVADRTSVSLLGFDPLFKRGDFAGSASPRQRPYVLFVGMRRDYKNFTGLAEAFAASQLPRKGFDLVAVGGGTLSRAERDMIDRLVIADRVEQVDADDQALGSLYRHAAVFACPSLYEGFGIPPLEAMAAGCPVVAMHASSLPEVCGGAAQYAEPGNRDSLIAALETVALNPGRAAELRQAGGEQITRFSWDRCAEQTAAVYRALA